MSRPSGKLGEGGNSTEGARWSFQSSWRKESPRDQKGIGTGGGTENLFENINLSQELEGTGVIPAGVTTKVTFGSPVWYKHTGS